jgi:hypothetical protein
MEGFGFCGVSLRFGVAKFPERTPDQCLGLRKDSIDDFEIAMRWAGVSGCIAGTIKPLHCGLADRAKEGPGHRFTTTE